MISPTLPEPLEARVAPAVFFLSGTANQVLDATGADANSAADATAVSSTIAVKLAKGDSLVLDTDGDHMADQGEKVFALISGGKAILYATDKDATVGFLESEITGLAVSDGFKATITGTLNGSVATMLDKTGAFVPGKLANASIAGLTVTERMTGSILAGGDIKNIDIGKSATSTARSVQVIATGTAAGATPLQLSGTGSVPHNFSFTSGLQKGPSISKVTLAHGALSLQASNGANSFNGSAGGSISGVTMTFDSDAVQDITIYAGEGGQGFTGGAGGSIKNVHLTLSADQTGKIDIRGGTGGFSRAGVNQSGAGGAGGSVTDVHVQSTAKVLGGGLIAGGDGGNAPGNSNARGGNGGALSKITWETLGGNGSVTFQGGDGGAGGGKGSGGAGGSAAGVTAKVGSIAGGKSTIYGGDGGQGGLTGKGGRGGSVTAFDLSCVSVRDWLWISAGDGGRGGAGGGNGGDSTSGRLTGGNAGPGDSNHNAGFYIYGGNGGDGSPSTPTGKARGGNGGKVSKVVADFGNSASFNQFMGGAGGDGRNAPGGKGGGIFDSTFTENGDTTGSGSLDLHSGDGGDVSGSGRGGDAGMMKNVTFIKNGSAAQPDIEKVRIYTGAGGDGLSAGGNAGLMTKVTVDLQFPVASLDIFTGDGGEADITGGNGGTISGLDLRISASIPSTQIISGSGGAAGGAGGKGGNAGVIKATKLTAPLATVLFRTGDGGAATNAAAKVGGTGGTIDGLTGTIDELSVIAGRGGHAGQSGTAGKGGAGGNVKNIKPTTVDSFIRLLEAGDGGDAKFGGAAGSITNVVTTSDIGGFLSTFGVSSDAGKMGGLIAGQGGTGDNPTHNAPNGSIANITATRIAAILAGAPAANQVSVVNAVTKITGLKNVTAIGADTGAAGFDPTGYTLDSGMTVLDGLVIVKTGGFTTRPVEPLKIFEV